MTGLVDVLAAHEQRHRPQTGDSTCSCGEWVGPMTTLFGADERRAHRTHLAEVLLAHLRAVAADEGVRERVANTVPLGWTERDPYRDVFEAADAAVTAFLDHLDHGRAGDAGEGEL